MKKIIADVYVYLYNFKTSNFYADFSSNNSLTILLIIGLVFLWGLTILCLISNLFILVDMPTVASKIVYDGIPLVFFLAIAVAIWILFALVFNKKILKLKELPKYNGPKAMLKATGIIVGTFLLAIIISV